MYIEYVKLDDVPDQFPIVKKTDVNKYNQIKNDVDNYVNIRYLSENSGDQLIQEIQEFNSKYGSSRSSTKITDDHQVERFSDLLFEFNDNQPTVLKEDSVFHYEANSTIFESADKDKNKKKNLHGIMLRYHNPHYIIPIVSAYDSILGYLEIKAQEKRNLQGC